MITVNNLVHTYGKHEVLKGVELKIASKKIHGLVGMNGSGKTTLLKCLYGLIKVEAGRILLNGNPITKKEVSFLPSENFFYSNITAREYLSLVKNPTFVDSDWADLFDIPLDELIDGFSTGMKKKIAIIATFKQDKPYMILDEPFNGLDIESCHILQSLLLKQLEKEKTVLVTSHILESITKISDEIHVLEDGRIGRHAYKEGFNQLEKDLDDHFSNRNENLIDKITS
ncbi:MAG: ATP-binding cassette domain-containing protein [Reichenbachiella sp.]